MLMLVAATPCHAAVALLDASAPEPLAFFRCCHTLRHIHFRSVADCLRLLAFSLMFC